ncbi:efflux RND transporter periplasmic adaptor subunit [Desulfovibrio inopinatus]|uniref:efflux RND transporter periplasmic adaptor subunit n=1 Tax=Desulfovibrio inopinatus TaxID=102109 RepID=UPI0004210A56|nr:efflux RND transporter periplasmic adaptor subunit [Desulfovibrio inopinatus]
MPRELASLRIDKSNSDKPFRRRRRIWPYVWGACFIATVLVTIYVWRPFKTAVVLTRVSMAYPSRSLAELNASGYVVADRKAAVGSKITARLVWLGVEEGESVKEGQIIARLESDDVNAALQRAEANLEAATHRVDEVDAELYDANLNHSRLKKLVAKGVLARSEYDSANARYKKALAAKRRALAEVEVARKSLDEAHISVGYTEIRAPFDAVVLTKNANVGDIITPIGAATDSRAAVVTIADMQSLQVEADVSEANIGKVHPDQPTEIRLDALGEERFPGHVHRIVPTADRSKATVLVKVRFNTLDPRILPEMSAKTAFLKRPLTPEELQPVPAVAKTAVVQRDGQTVAFLVEKGKAHAVSVSTGMDLGDSIEILSGLQPGDSVLLDPPADIEDGVPVRVVEKDGV